MQIHTGSIFHFTKGKIFFYLFSLLLFLLVGYYFSEIKTDVALFEKVAMPWLLTAIVLQIGTYYFGAVAYRNLLTAFGLTNIPSLFDFFKATIIMLLFNQTIPSVGISGNAFFYSFMGKNGTPKPKILLLILVELLIFYGSIIAVLLFIMGISFVFWPLPTGFLIVLVLGVVLYVFLAWSIQLVGDKELVQNLRERFLKLPIIRKHFTASWGLGLREAGSPWHTLLNLRRSVVFKNALAQIAILLSDAFTVYALFAGIGVKVSPWVVFVGFMLARIIASLPISPGSLIVYEAGMSFFYSALGVPLASAIIVTLLYRFMSFWLPMPIGLWFYRRIKSSEKNIALT